MEPSEFTIIKRIKFNKADLESIKDYGNLHTSKSFVSNIPGIRYLIAIFPHGDLEKHRGQTRIFLCLELPTGMKVEADVIFSVESANFTTVLKQLYDKSIGWGKVLCTTTTLFDPAKKFFAADNLIIEVNGRFKVELPPRIVYPFSVEWRIKEDELAALKTSEDDDRIESDVFFLSSHDPYIYYFLTIFPNGNCYETRGKACIFSHAPFGAEAILEFSIESANYSYVMQYLYNNENIVRGTFPCTTEDLFKPEKKFIVNGEMVIKVNGTLWIEKEKEPTILALEKGIVQKGYHRGRNFTFVIEEKFIKVHKHVLQRASPFFVEFFNSDMKEVKEKKMIILDFDYEIVHAAMKLLYSASIPTTFSFEQMLSLLHFSNKYDIVLIKDRVEDYLIKKISSINVCSILLFTKTTVSSTQLQQKCIDFIVKKLGENQTIFGLETLDEEVMMKILLSLNTHSA